MKTYSCIYWVHILCCCAWQGFICWRSWHMAQLILLFLWGFSPVERATCDIKNSVSKLVNCIILLCSKPQLSGRKSENIFSGVPWVYLNMAKTISFPTTYTQNWKNQSWNVLLEMDVLITKHWSDFSLECIASLKTHWCPKSVKNNSGNHVVVLLCS